VVGEEVVKYDIGNKDLDQGAGKADTLKPKAAFERLPHLADALAIAMIRIDRGKQVKPGVYEYSVTGMGIGGHSSQPLLDACRQIQAILGDPCHQQAAIYREGKDQPDMTCPVDVGAKYRVAEDIKNGPRFRKFEPFDPSVFKSKEAVPA
jgi:hypothetical protein